MSDKIKGVRWVVLIKDRHVQPGPFAIYDDRPDALRDARAIAKEQSEQYGYEEEGDSLNPGFPESCEDTVMQQFFSDEGDCVYVIEVDNGSYGDFDAWLPDASKDSHEG